MKRIISILFAAIIFSAVYANAGTKDDGKRFDVSVAVFSDDNKLVDATIKLITKDDTLTARCGDFEVSCLGKSTKTGEVSMETLLYWGALFKQIPLGTVIVEVYADGYKPYRDEYKVFDVDEWNKEHQYDIAPAHLCPTVYLERIKTPKKKKK